MSNSGGHDIALQLEKEKNEENQLEIVKSTKGMRQQRVDTMHLKNAREAYTKLIKTAYEMALHPTMPLKQFKTFVKVMRLNGVQLVKGEFFMSY